MVRPKSDGEREKGGKTEQEGTWEDEVEELVDKIASIDDLVIWPESELVLLLLDGCPTPLELCASAACSHICKNEAMISYHLIKITITINSRFIEMDEQHF